ncbi:MAG: ABC transporter permease, partial [Blastocatellia bacterium]|nr:ABC transporter permease [Blastocatellia bacterium]
KVMTMIEATVKDIRSVLWVLLGAVGFVLLIACANVANLLLAKAAGRQKEIAIRSTLGAGRWRIVRQMLTESLLLSFSGGLLGLLLAIWGTSLLLQLAPEDLPRANEVTLDSPVLIFTVIIALLTGLIFGLAPALQASKPNLNETIKDAGRGSTDGGRRQLIRSMLVVLEVSLALVLLVGAGLMIKSFLRMHKVSPGFDPTHALTASLVLPERKYPEDDQRAAFFKQLAENVAAIPGVQSAGVSQVLPMTGDDYILGFSIEGRPPYALGQEPHTTYYAVSPDYFKAMGIPLLKGRYFTDGDRKGTMRVAIINEAMARKMFPNEDPLGKRINVTNGPVTYREIVGIVGDVKQYSLTQENTLQTYEPHTQQPFGFMSLVVRAKIDPATLAESIRREVLQIDKEQPVDRVKTLAEYVTDSMSQQRFSMTLLGIFAGVAIALAVMGIYGVMSYSVTQRNQEIGIRIALGARSRDVFKLVLGQGMILALIGIAIGLAAAFAVTRVLSLMLYSVSATDPSTFALISALLLLVALIACYLPARRATRIDPLVAMRSE